MVASAVEHADNNYLVLVGIQLMHNNVGGA
jgi:hypothetical protein